MLVGIGVLLELGRRVGCLVDCWVSVRLLAWWELLAWWRHSVIIIDNNLFLNEWSLFVFIDSLRLIVVVLVLALPAAHDAKTASEASKSDIDEAHTGALTSRFAFSVHAAITALRALGTNSGAEIDR